MAPGPKDSKAAALKSPRGDLEQIALALQGLQFGAVTVIVQDGVVIQIDRLERRRLRKAQRTRNDGNPAADSQDGTEIAP